MTFGDIPAGSRIFVDANIFIYHFTPHPVFGPPCTALFSRIQNSELTGFTSAHELSDVAHRLMTVEAMTAMGWPATGIVGRLKKNPTVVIGLQRYLSAVKDIAQLGIQVLPVSGAQVFFAADLSQQTGLLSSDALIVLNMRDHGLTHLASNDADFDRAPGLTRYAPI